VAQHHEVEPAAAARDYVRTIEAALAVPAELLGVGPGRDAISECSRPFDRRGSR
jgi:adenylosuccinate synthase